MPTRPSFLTLPLEMRLEVYDWCTILTRLILTHTCRTCYTDIKTRPEIIQRCRWLLCSEHVQTKKHPLLPDGITPICIAMIANEKTFGRRDFLESSASRREQSKEAATFNRVYGSSYPGRGLWCCECCMMFQYMCFHPSQAEKVYGMRLCEDCDPGSGWVAFGDYAKHLGRVAVGL
ncbi:hypothetical protein BJ508DRAFT_333546 [Ascobolus immersus RN42]|uniref:F-box domain-containing protein n=1 Tax=Ascobolus immersus RN42 TaxID=1160509 RepID=A0A3N4HJC7_ASCIM|nr:hypothetical protein BJ508DRAFT_333546 [Ascobolus immersus RN42]